MSDPVNAWKQTGRVYLWRYPQHLTKRQGWHFTAEDEACDSLTQLVEAMRRVAETRRRTIAITKPTQPIWGVPNFGEPTKEALGPLTLVYDPLFPDLRLVEEDDRLLLRVGSERIDDLLTGLRDVRRGEGDYAYWANDKNTAPPLWFWWMPWSGSQ
jgi:hypothetical protein